MREEDQEPHEGTMAGACCRLSYTNLGSHVPVPWSIREVTRVRDLSIGWYLRGQRGEQMVDAGLLAKFVQKYIESVVSLSQ